MTAREILVRQISFCVQVPILQTTNSLCDVTGRVNDAELPDRGAVLQLFATEKLHADTVTVEPLGSCRRRFRARVTSELPTMESSSSYRLTALSSRIKELELKHTTRFTIRTRRVLVKD